MAGRNAMMLLGLAASVLGAGGCCWYETEPTDCSCCLVDPEEYDNKVEQLYRTQAILACCNRHVYRLRSEKGQLSAALAAARARADRAEYDLAAAEKSLAETEAEVKSLRQAVEDHERAKVELEQVSADLAKARADLDAARVEASEKGNRAGQLDEQVANLNSQVEALKVQLAETTRRLSEALDAGRQPARPGPRR